MRKHVWKTLGTAALVLGLTVPAGAPALANVTTPAPSTVATSQAQLASWVAWDGNRITTSTRCQSRKQYLINTYQLRPVEIKCQYFPPLTLHIPGYYMVMVLQGAL